MQNLFISRYRITLVNIDLGNCGDQIFLGFLENCPSYFVKGLKYLDSHEWVKVEGNSATVGITDHAQDHLGDVVYVELPEVGAPVSHGSSFGAVESVKATSDINSPISGKVVEVNEELNSSPGLINSSPYDKGWIIKVEVSNSGELNSLMDADKYTKFCEEEDGSH
ncbi:hypothetical protein ACB094_07G050700 [Castanea mollissima]